MNKLEKPAKPDFYLECKSCKTLWNIIGTTPKLRGRLLINPLTALCYLCEKEWGLSPILPVWEFNERKQEWQKVEPIN